MFFKAVFIDCRSSLIPILTISSLHSPISQLIKGFQDFLTLVFSLSSYFFPNKVSLNILFTLTFSPCDVFGHSTKGFKVKAISTCLLHNLQHLPDVADIKY